jgi:hypothetical protein
MDGPLLLAVGGSLDQSHTLADALRYRRWRTRSWSTSLYVGLNQLAKRVCTTEAGTFLNYTTTVVNGTDSRLSARYGGISVDGHTAPPLWVLPLAETSIRRSEKANQTWWSLGKSTA